ncbi:aromatic amino acid lyase, partial [Kineococcus rubinsiae]|uniref:aromatic amino acid lyase n=1 Tax=Kineococcus rubinsiae TaxID=2609562 RepID=UPI0014315270
MHDAPLDAHEVRLDGSPLPLDALADLASGRARAVVDPGALARLVPLHHAMLAARERGDVYGATTGVGGNRHVRVDLTAEPGPQEHPAAGEGEPAEDAGARHGLRLLRSHAASTGPVLDAATARAALAVRLNQLLAGGRSAGGAGVSPPVVAALARAVETGAVPTLHVFGGIGTADLAQMAELGLTLVGERPWAQPGTGRGVHPVELGPADALPLMSSGAVTLATAALAAREVHTLLRASLAVGALSFLALRGNPQAFAEAVHTTRAHHDQPEVAAQLRRLVQGSGTPVRLQDPFGLRVLPQVLAPALAALRHLEDVLLVETSSVTENPLVTTAGVLHHGQFHTAALANALDAARAAVHPVLTLSAARLGLLMRPEHTGLRAFVAVGPAGSSGLMISEYVVQDVLGELRAGVSPTTAAALSISLGLEEHASFATQGARALRRVADLAPIVVGAEALAATRALRVVPDRLTRPARPLFALLDAAVDADLTDHPLGEDLGRVVALLPGVAALVPRPRRRGRTEGGA